MRWTFPVRHFIRSLLRGPVWISLMTVTAACPEKPKDSDQLYFEDFVSPLGVNATVVYDKNLNAPTGSSINVNLFVDNDIDRDELDKLVRSYYRQAQARKGFKQGTADQIDIRIYATEGRARSGSDEWLARAHRVGPSGKPTFENRQEPPLLKWIKKALGKMPQYTGSLQPTINADTKAMAASITLPFVKSDGSGKPVDHPSYGLATTTFTATVRSLFSAIETLRTVTFSGTHKGATLIKVTLKRSEYGRINFGRLEEELGRFQGAFASQLMAQKITDDAVTKKVSERRRSVYSKAFAHLPEDRVLIDAKRLK